MLLGIRAAGFAKSRHDISQHNNVPNRFTTQRSLIRESLHLYKRSIDVHIRRAFPQHYPYQSQADGGEGGGGNRGGDGDGNDNNNGDNDNDDDATPQFSGNAWVLFLAAGASLGLFSLYQKRKSSSGSFSSRSPQLPPLYDSDDINTLRRLLRDVFTDLVKVRARLDEVESTVGISNGGPPSADASKVTRSSSSGAHSARHAHSSRTDVVNGSLEVGGGLLWADEEVESSSGESVRHTGVRLGTDLLFRLGSRVREGADLVIAEFRADPVRESMFLQKVLYNFRVSDALRIVLSPFGAKGQDVAYTLNPVAGRGLTALVTHGSPLHQHVLGSLLGAAIDFRKAWFSLGYFSRASASQQQENTSNNASNSSALNEDFTPSTFSLLGQAVVEALPGLSVGLTYLQDGDGSGLLQDGVAQLSLAGQAIAATSPASTPRYIPNNAGSARQLCGTFALRVAGDMAISGWAAANANDQSASSQQDAGFSFESFKSLQTPREWGLVMSSQQSGSRSGWLVGMGYLASLGPASSGSNGGKGDGFSSGIMRIQEPNMFELSTTMDLGDGMAVMPGMVVMRQRGQSTVFAGVRAAWSY